MNIGATRGTASAFTRNASVIARGRVDALLIQLFGALRYRIAVAREERNVRPGDIAIFDLTRPIAILGSAMNELCVMLDRGVPSRLVHDLERSPVHLLRRGTPLNAILSNHMKTLCAQAGELTTAAADSISIATTSLIGACLERSEEPSVRRNAALAVGIQQLVLQEIEANLTNKNLDVEFLTGRFRMSRASLYRMFEADGGLMRYSQARRSNHSPNLPLKVILLFQQGAAGESIIAVRGLPWSLA